jgi:(p)ppGpp synthase/HD superfamily hydrolase
MVTFEDLIKPIREYNPEEEEIITKAYHFTEEHFKGNGYQALHITSLLNKKRRIQFRIKTFEMENKSRNGITNYWFTFKGKAPDKMLETLERECKMFQIIKQMVTNYNYETEDVRKLNIVLNN